MKESMTTFLGVPLIDQSDLGPNTHFTCRRTRKLPRHATYSVITSPGGAAIQDMLNILGRRAPFLRITVIPALVQGDQAPAEIIADPKRVTALKETGLLDSPPQASYDQLAELASRLLGVPTALMSLVDKDRQFFKSQVGLALPWAAARQTRLSHSFCQWVVSGQEDVVIEDARTHPVLRSNLAIKDLGVIAYAGVPVHARAGEAIGSLCAIDSKPRRWSEDDLATLQDLARVTEAWTLLQQPGGQAATPDGATAALQACGSAVQGLTRVLHRHAARIDQASRAELLELIRQKGCQLLQLAG